MDDLKVASGEPVSAKKHNLIVDKLLDQQLGTGASTLAVNRTTVKVKNNSGRDYSIGELFQITSFAGPTGNAPFSALANPVYNATQPTWHTAIDNLAIASRPVADGEWGEAVISGICVASVTATVGAHRYVMVDPTDEFDLTPADAGIARVLGGIGSTHAWVMMGEKQTLWRYKLTQDNQSPSTTTAELLELDGTIYDSAITLRDPLSVGSEELDNHDGYCHHVGNHFEIGVGPCP